MRTYSFLLCSQPRRIPCQRMQPCYTSRYLKICHHRGLAQDYPATQAHILLGQQRTSIISGHTGLAIIAETQWPTTNKRSRRWSFQEGANLPNSQQLLSRIITRNSDVNHHSPHECVRHVKFTYYYSKSCHTQWQLRATIIVISLSKSTISTDTKQYTAPTPTLIL